MGSSGGISVFCMTAAIGSALTAGHFWKRAPKVTKRALAPPLGASPRLGMPAVRHCSVGPPRSAIHGRVAATPASMPGCPLRNTCLRPSWFNGAPEIKIKSQIKSRATATAMPKPGREAAFPPVGAGLSDRRIAAMAAERTHQSVRYSFVIVNDHRRQELGVPPAPTGLRLPLPLLHTTQAGCQAAVLLLLILILGAPLNHDGRRQVLRSGHPGRDAGVAATRPWMADRGGPTEQCLTAGMPSLGEAPSGGACTGQPHRLQKSAFT